MNLRLSKRFPILTALAIGVATLNIPHAQANDHQLTQYQFSSDRATLAQVNSITQLRDVTFQDWSYEALRNLVEQYGCIEGYPDRTYRGGNFLTRDEFAAGLNSCLEALESRLQEQETTIDVPPAQTNESAGISTNDMINRAFYNDTGRFYDLTNISGQANKIFGWRHWENSFLDRMIADDAELLNSVSKDMLEQQNAHPLIRTRDLPNPYGTSVFENPDYVRPSTPAPMREIRF
ncbi:MAG: S-layer homology domain-containing protein [Microcystaceae cyanobacterium]